METMLFLYGVEERICAARLNSLALEASEVDMTHIGSDNDELSG
jgi:hypothetical protein